MSEVKRYNVKLVGNMEPSPTGDWITFWDHLDATAELRRGLEEATRKREHTQQWYAQRWDRLKQWARKEIPDEFSNQFFSILANGAKDVMEQPSTYDQQFNLLAAERDKLKRELEEVRKMLEIARGHALAGDKIETLHALDAALNQREK